MSNSAKVIDNQNNIPCIFIFRWVLWWTHWKIKLEMFIVWIGVSTPLKKITPSFSLSPLLNLQIVRPRFLGQNPYISVFRESPSKKLDFSVNLHNIKFFILNRIPSFKSNQIRS